MRQLWMYLLAISIPTHAYLASSDKTYVIDGQDRVTWDEAFKLCQQRDMELVSVESAVENDHLRQILGPVASASPGVAKDFWTSGKLTEGNQWVWASTGRPLTYSDWVTGAPNDYLGHEKCLRLWGLHRFQWDDFFCQAKLHFICQKRAMIPAEDPKPGSFDRRQPEDQDLSYGDDQPESDFEFAHVVTVRGPPEELKPWVAPPTRRVPPKATIQRTTSVRPWPMDSPVLRLRGCSFTVFTQVMLGWEEARAECNGRQMELAVIGKQAEKIREFLQKNGLDQNSYWIGYLHVRLLDHRSRAKRAVKPWLEQAEQPSVQLTIGVKPGPGNFLAGAPTDQCPLLQPTDGMRMTFERCQAKNYFICEKPGPDVI